MSKAASRFDLVLGRNLISGPNWWVSRRPVHRIVSWGPVHCIILYRIAKTSASYRIVGTGARAAIQNTDGRSHTNLSCWFSNGVHPLLFCWCGFKVWHCRGEKCVWLLVGKILLYTSGKSGNILYWRAIYMMGMFVANWQSWYWEEGGHQNTSLWRGWAAFPQVLLEKLLGEEMRFALWMTPGHLHPQRLSQLTFYIYLTNV